MSDAVLFDGWCGEPIAWARVGEPVIGHEWTEHGQVAVTERLTPTEAISKYGPIAELIVGPQGGFKSVTYGEQKFVSRCVDPRGTGLYEDSVVVVHDPIRENYECPVCGAAPADQCLDDRQRPRGTHNNRRHGRDRWEIERAETAARKAREDAEAAEKWQREMATAPAIGAVLERGRPDLTDRFTVEQTFANRTVRATADSGDHVFLARNEHNGLWYAICGQPTSMRLPCRNPFSPRCQVRHNEALQLREDEPWS